MDNRSVLQSATLRFPDAHGLPRALLRFLSVCSILIEQTGFRATLARQRSAWASRG